MVIKGKFADGSPMLAIPNYARTNRDKELPLEGALPVGADGAVRPAQRPPTSVIESGELTGRSTPLVNNPSRDRSERGTMPPLRLLPKDRRLKEAWRRNT